MMRTTRIYVVLLALLLSMPVIGQTPFLEDGKRWKCQMAWFVNEQPERCEYDVVIGGDTLIGDLTCKKVLWSMPIQDAGELHNGGALFEDGKKVYDVSSDGKITLLYDFGLDVGESFDCEWMNIQEHITLVAADTITINNIKRRRMEVNILLHATWDTNIPDGEITDVWIEGIGSLIHVLRICDVASFPSDDFYTDVCYQGDEMVFSRDAYMEEYLNGIDDARQVGTVKSSGIYDLHGHRLSDVPQHGIYIQDGRKRVR